MIIIKTLSTSDGITLSYRVARFNYTKPTLVFLHGFSGNHTAWFPLAHRFEREQFNTIIPDLRGHGLSSKMRAKSLYTFPRFVEDLDELLQTERVKNAVLVGYSAGGVISLLYAATHPSAVDRLVLISTNHINPLEYWHAAWATPLVQAILEAAALLGKWFERRRYLFFDMTTMHSYLEATLQGLRSMPLDVNLWCLAAMGDLNLSTTLRNITQPTLLLRGHHDPYYTLTECRDMLEKLPKGDLKIVPNANHFLVTRYPEQIYEYIRDFLSPGASASRVR